jgi:hypothetical protein
MTKLYAVPHTGTADTTGGREDRVPRAVAPGTGAEVDPSPAAALRPPRRRVVMAGVLSPTRRGLVSTTKLTLR